MKILVTGYHGYIGTVLCPMLLERGHSVVGLDSDYFADCVFLKDSEWQRAYSSIKHLKRDMREVEIRDLEGCDAIFHLAALSNDPIGKLNPKLTDDINHLASIRLAKLAKQAGVRRFIFSASCSVYGAGDGNDKPLTEEASFNPLSAYAVSKVETERDLRLLADKNFSPVYLRNATAYGLSPFLRVDLVVNNLTGWAVTTGEVRILSDGTPWRPIVHLRDISAAFIAAAEAPIEAVHNQAFNVGVNSENYQVRDIASLVQKIVPRCKVTYAGTGEPDNRSYRVDFGKIARVLPTFRPQWNLEKGIIELYDAYKARGLTLADFESRLFTRLKQLQHLQQAGQLDNQLRWQA